MRVTPPTALGLLLGANTLSQKAAAFAPSGSAASINGGTVFHAVSMPLAKGQPRVSREQGSVTGRARDALRSPSAALSRGWGGLKPLRMNLSRSGDLARDSSRDLSHDSSHDFFHDSSHDPVSQSPRSASNPDLNSPPDHAAYLQRLERVFVGLAGQKVALKAGAQWRFSPSTQTVEYPAIDMQPEKHTENLGALLRQVGHCLYARPAAVDVKTSAPFKLLLETVEFVRLRKLLESRYPGGAAQVLSAADQRRLMPFHNALRQKTLPANSPVDQRGQPTLAEQFCALALEEGIRGEPFAQREQLDARVLAAYEASQAALTQATVVPDNYQLSFETPSEETISDWAANAFWLTFKAIWPQFEVLVHADDAALGEVWTAPPDARGKGDGDSAEREGATREPEQSENSAEGEGGDTRPDPNASPSQPSDEAIAEDDEASVIQPGGDGNVSSDPSEQSEELRRHYEALTDALVNTIEEAEPAEPKSPEPNSSESESSEPNESTPIPSMGGSTDAADDAADAPSGGDAVADPRSGGAGANFAKQADVDDGLTVDPSDDTAATVVHRIRGTREYAQLAQAHRREIQDTVAALRAVFDARDMPALTGHYRRGVLDLRKYIQSQLRDEVGAATTSRFFLKRTAPTETGTAVMICVDASGSMADRLPAVKAGLVTLAEALRAVDIPYGALSFNYGVRHIKSLKQPPTAERSERMIRALVADGNTKDRPALTAAANALRAHEAERRVIFFLTDGFGSVAQAQAVKDLEEEGFYVIGISLGEGQNAVADTYTHHVLVDDIQQLPHQLLSALEKVLLAGD